MIWALFRWTWLLEAPLYVGGMPAGSLNRCRLYVPARAVWGAVTAELAPRQAKGFPDYEAVGTVLRDSARFTYLFPAEEEADHWRAWLPGYGEGTGLTWQREDPKDVRPAIPDRAMRMRLLGTRPATAIDPTSDTATEGALRETECISTLWRGEQGAAASRVALVGYVFLRAGAADLGSLERISVGGDTRYGLGRLRQIQWHAASTVFGRAARLEGDHPSVESDCLFAHAEVQDDRVQRLRGEREALVGWEYRKRGVQHLASALWMPGTVSNTAEVWSVGSSGWWHLPS